MNARLAAGMVAAICASSAKGSTAEPLPIRRERFNPGPVGMQFLPFRSVASGIPNPPRVNQRKRRKLARRVKPHGWKGGAK